MIGQIQAQSNFGITFDQVNQVWVNIPPSEIGSNTTWLLKFTFNQGLYTVSYRTLTYSFGSARDTFFFFDKNSVAYDSTTGLTVPDIIKILKINNQPASGSPLAADIIWQIYNTVTEADGFVDQTQILVRSPETQMTGVPDNPDLYTTVANVAPSRSSLYRSEEHTSELQSH